MKTKPGGSKPDKGNDQANIMEMYRELANVQQAAIHAMAAALAATEYEKENDDEDEDEDEEDEDKEKEDE